MSLPKKKVGEFLGHFNDVFLFLKSTKEKVSNESETKKGMK